MFKPTIAALLLALAATAADAQLPRAVITGPREADTGDLIVLDASASEGVARCWLLAVAPVPKSFLPVDSGIRCMFASGTPGRYVFVLCVAGTNPNGGPAVEMATHEVMINGQLPTPDPQPGPLPPAPPTPKTTWTTTGLHVLVIDDENERGRLPQSQINIFASKPLAEYLASKCPKEADGKPAFRFASNDALSPGSKAREQELAVWVEGWDLLIEAVDKGNVKLPAWIVSDGRRGMIEPLPATVDACIARLKEFQ